MRQTHTPPLSLERFECPDGVTLDLAHYYGPDNDGIATRVYAIGATLDFPSRAAAVSWLLAGRLPHNLAAFGALLSERPAATGPLPKGELWQECRRRGCDEEPVCVICEYCARHCGCRSGDPHAEAAGYLPGEPYGGDE